MIARSKFGIRAQQKAEGYVGGDLPLLVVSADGAVPAIQEGVRMRERGQRFDCAFVIDEPYVAQSRLLGVEILRSSQDFDQRRNAFELLDRGHVSFNGSAQAQYGLLSEAIAGTLHDLAALCEHFVVQSWREYRKIQTLLGVRRPARIGISPDNSIPRVTVDATADAVVVWAPDSVPEEISVLLFALEEVRRPSYVVARPGPTYGLKTVVVVPQACERVLARARVVIDASADSPRAALTLASRGFRTVASIPSGAVQYAPSIELYEPRSRRSVFGAVASAAGKPPSKVTFARPAVPSPPARVSVRERAPLTSVIVRWHSRPLEFLRRAVAGVQAQTYPNIEALIVNDGGDPSVPALVESEFPRARVLNQENGGVARAGTAGVREARGKYAGFCDDDDFLFPDHIERLVDVLERSGALSAHTSGMNAYFSPAGRNFSLRGYRAVLVPAVEPSTMLSICQVVGSARMLFHRAWVEASGPFEPSIAPADDYEMWLRLLAADDVANVDAVTWLYSQFSNSENASVAQGSVYAQAHRTIYRMHPCERVAVIRRREELVTILERNGGHGMFAPVVTFDPQPLLFQPKNGQGQTSSADT